MGAQGGNVQALTMKIQAVNRQSQTIQRYLSDANKQLEAVYKSRNIEDPGNFRIESQGGSGMFSGLLGGLPGM